MWVVNRSKSGAAKLMRIDVMIVIEDLTSFVIESSPRPNDTSVTTRIISSIAQVLMKVCGASMRQATIY